MDKVEEYINQNYRGQNRTIAYMIYMKLKLFKSQVTVEDFINYMRRGRESYTF